MTSFTCGQIFTITINETDQNCSAGFDGDYQMSFNLNCRYNETVCNTFINDNGGTLIELQVSLDCATLSYQTSFDGTMTFYDNFLFNVSHDSANNYVIGQDMIYVQVEVDIPNDYDIFSVSIDNVFVCTATDSVDLFSNLNNANSLNVGCLSSDIDGDGSYDIIINGIENALYSVEIISP